MRNQRAIHRYRRLRARLSAKGATLFLRNRKRPRRRIVWIGRGEGICQLYAHSGQTKRMTAVPGEDCCFGRAASIDFEFREGISEPLHDHDHEREQRIAPRQALVVVEPDRLEAPAALDP